MNINLTLIGQMVFFALFVLFCMKYVWPPILGAMAERREKISSGLAAADRAKHNLAQAQDKAVERLKEAKDQAAVIIDAANKRAGQIVDEAKEQARVEGDRIKEAARAEIDQDVNRAREELRGKVATLALAGAEQILGAEVDQQRHAALVEKLAAEL